MNNPKFRVINACKPEMGMVSKNMLSKIISTVKAKSHLLQWKNSDSVIDWFKTLQDKKRVNFIQFDVIDFYGSISKELLENSIKFVSKYIKISDLGKSAIMHVLFPGLLLKSNF